MTTKDAAPVQAERASGLSWPSGSSERAPPLVRATPERLSLLPRDRPTDCYSQQLPFFRNLVTLVTWAGAPGHCKREPSR